MVATPKRKNLEAFIVPSNAGDGAGINEGIILIFMSLNFHLAKFIVSISESGKKESLLE